MTLPIPRRLALVTVFGLGHMRPFPGTWGSLPPVFIAGGLFAVGVGPATAPVQFIAAMVALVVIFSAACVVLGDREGVLSGFVLSDLADLLGVSEVEVDAGAHEAVVRDLRDRPRCERSWKRDGTVRERSDGGMLSDRDAEAVGVG